MGTKMTAERIEKTFEELNNEIEALADEIEIKLKLATMDARDKWRNTMEPKLFEARMHVREAKEHSKKAIVDTMKALREFSAVL